MGIFMMGPYEYTWGLSCPAFAEALAIYGQNLYSIELDIRVDDESGRRLEIKPTEAERFYEMERRLFMVACIAKIEELCTQGYQVKFIFYVQHEMEQLGNPGSEHPIEGSCVDDATRWLNSCDREREFPPLLGLGTSSVDLDPKCGSVGIMMPMQPDGWPDAIVAAEQTVAPRSLRLVVVPSPHGTIHKLYFEDGETLNMALPRIGEFMQAILRNSKTDLDHMWIGLPKEVKDDIPG